MITPLQAKYSQNPLRYFVTAIGTDSGKTLASAVLAEAFKADYWKPVQAGFPRDTQTVQSLISNTETQFYPEKYLLKTPASPHYAAQLDGIQISLDDMVLPTYMRPIIVEGAGGVLVPLNHTDFVIDIPQRLQIPILLVANLYLGSINHTLLAIREIQARNLPIAGIIFNGEPNEASEKIILHHTHLKVFFRIPKLLHVNKQQIRILADELLRSNEHQKY